MTTGMPGKLEQIYDLITETPNQAADAALVAALPHMRDPLRETALDRLFDRGHLSGLGPLIANFADYDEDIRTRILERVDDLYEAVRVATSSDQVKTRLAGITIIRTSCNFRLAYLLAEALPRRCPRTTAAAAEALCAVTKAYLERYDDRDAPDTDLRNLNKQGEYLAGAIERAVESWASHFRTEVLIAAMWLFDRTESTLSKKAALTRSHLARALNTASHGGVTPLMACYTLRGLTHPDLRAAAARGIAESTDTKFIERLLDHAWVLADKDNAQACRWIRSMVWLDHDPDALAGLSEERTRRLLHLIACSGFAVSRKLTLYQRLLSSESDPVREAALWRVTEIDTPEATDLLHRVKAWNEPALSAIASLELFRREPQAQMRNEPTSTSATPAPLEDSATAACKAYWAHADEMNPDQLLRQGEELRDHNSRFPEFVRLGLADGEATRRLQALNVVRTLDMVDAFPERIFALCHDNDHRVRSMAISLIPDVPGATAMRIARQALNDPDNRVQANAVEALDGMPAAEWLDMIKTKLDTEDNRVRANAIKALLPHRVRESAEQLLLMLDDESGRNRLSALWVVEQLALTTLKSRIQQIALDDPDERVRERARFMLLDTFSSAETIPMIEPSGGPIQ
jgi:HEAT repeat protein